MRILVFGGRDYLDRDHFFATLDRCHFVHPDMEVISGMARGADKLAFEWAHARGVKCHEFPADWNKYGKRAGPIRNQQMLDEGKPDAGVAFPGGNGTRDMFTRLTNAGIPVLDLRNRKSNEFN